MTEPMAEGLDGLVNLRDLGDLPTLDDQITRSGVIYRSDAPHDGDRAPTGFVQWPPTAVIDLRDTVEYGTQPHPLAEVATIHRIPLLEGMRGEASEQDGLTALYQAIIAGAAKKLVEVFRIAVRTEGAVLIHCAAGKDRTGIASALLLSAAGVRPDSIVTDYTRTDRNMLRVLQRLNVLDRLPPGVADSSVEELLAAPVHAIESVLARFDEYQDAAAGWLTAQGVTEVEIADWRERFLTGRPEPAERESDLPG
jgi:hypothetical protein